MSDFEEYYKSSEWFGTYESDLMMRDAYIAGQQSQQAKIDELQAKVDKALRFYNEAKSPHNIGMIQMAIYLKGNKDENY